MKNPTQPLPDLDCAVDAQALLAHRDYLLRVARRKLRDVALAEDAVHDVFEAVLSGKARFGGRSALRSWLTGILLHKVTDLQRQDMRYCSLDASTDDDGANPSHDVPCEAARPEEHAEQRELLSQVLARIDRLPAALRDVMQWRVLQDDPTESVCERLGITADSMFVRLHRARRQLAAA